jgi:hypothetical protein
MRLSTLELHITVVDDGVERKRWNGEPMSSAAIDEAFKLGIEAMEEKLREHGVEIARVQHGTTSKEVPDPVPDPPPNRRRVRTTADLEQSLIDEMAAAEDRAFLYGSPAPRPDDGLRIASGVRLDDWRARERREQQAACYRSLIRHRFGYVPDVRPGDTITITERITGS